MMEFNNIKSSEIIFKEKLFASDYSVIFLVMVRGRICVMKVHHGRGPRRYYEPKDRELDIHVLESAAYQRLKERGLCGRGVVPHFIGMMEKFDPQPFQPHLKMFLHDKYLPSAIFLEYIPNLEMIHLHNYSQKRMDNFIKGLQEIHGAGVRHRDPKPRNMMVVKDDSERVVWIDFDRAETYNIPVTDEQKRLLDEEEEIVLGFRDCLQADCAKGKLDEAYLFYCT
ncbi:hypothetical protein RJZ56_003245 [Blastomyces dermatitidis]|nr:hypothetical protein BDDG_08606 [Blastomyces dermatitidis ATCC 18188]EQL33834.1 hypothetical protein BDFG_04219 [Blastomyces dermatitidis ATCC 26199]EQL33835.1 hypothetical protein, variant [Blastomyces dermatitidis ATCC 26199]KMW68689.1 hypothetical protein, variant [Blastomyces dermatitidis ATCC 18188]